MGEILKERIKQRRFKSPAHEAILNLMVAAKAAPKKATVAHKSVKARNGKNKTQIAAAGRR